MWRKNGLGRAGAPKFYIEIWRVYIEEAAGNAHRAFTAASLQKSGTFQAETVASTGSTSST